MSGFLPDYTGAEVRVSPNFGPRRDGLRPDIILLHYTGMETRGLGRSLAVRSGQRGLVATIW